MKQFALLILTIALLPACGKKKVIAAQPYDVESEMYYTVEEPLAERVSGIETALDLK